jgi:L-ribulose-5-phosphate 3-epimerase
MKRCIITDQVNSDFEEALKKCRKLGYPSVEIHALWGKTVEQLSEVEAYAAADLLKKYDIHAVMLATTLFLMAPLRETDTIIKFNPSYPVFQGTYAQHVEALQHTLKLAKIIGCSSVRVFPFRAPENRIVIGDEDDQFLIVDRFRTPVRWPKRKASPCYWRIVPSAICPKVR